MNDKGMLAPYLFSSSLVNLSKSQNSSQFKVTKDPNSIRKIPVALYSNILTFRDSIKSFN